MNDKSKQIYINILIIRWFLQIIQIEINFQPDIIQKQISL